MSTAVESIVTQAMQLSEEERGEIVDRLAGSLQPEDELSGEMKATLDRRWEEIESGKVKCIPHEEVMARLRTKLGV
jgi:putative addiction module component (TIGR02574 family)